MVVIRYSLFVIRYSLFVIRYSLFVIRYSLLNKLNPDQYLLQYHLTNKLLHDYLFAFIVKNIRYYLKQYKHSDEKLDDRQFRQSDN
ncbi:hypothetical protein CWI82_10800 [Pseudidiomarina tainanensis]|uniref:Uncharacterized protein n=1 Tax=Pseudidiomarina tainanensis TaxID=502365 RepID=A0ACD2HGP6_9GAMM|nr:hypothetical protein CWI82_10800 [Pseudidiomarina tainanensis]